MYTKRSIPSISSKETKKKQSNLLPLKRHKFPLPRPTNIKNQSPKSLSSQIQKSQIKR
jgi:hypothetical protein